MYILANNVEVKLNFQQRSEIELPVNKQNLSPILMKDVISFHFSSIKASGLRVEKVLVIQATLQNDRGVTKSKLSNLYRCKTNNQSTLHLVLSQLGPKIYNTFSTIKSVQNQKYITCAGENDNQLK